MDVSEIKSLIDLGKYEEAFQTSDNLTNPVEMKIFKSIASTLMGNYKLGMELANSSYKEAKSTESDELIFAALVAISHVKVWKVTLDHQLSIQNAFEYFNQMKNKSIKNYWYGFLLFIEGLNEHSPARTSYLTKYKKKVKEFLEVYPWDFLRFYAEIVTYASNLAFGKLTDIQELIKFKEDITERKFKLLAGYCKTLIAGNYLMAGNIDSFLDSMRQASEIWSQIKFNLGHLYYIASDGLYNLISGNLTKAMVLFNDVISESNSLETDFFVAGQYRLIGEVFYQQGKLKEALENNLRSLRIREENNDILGIGESSSHLGKIFQEIGDLKSAKNYLEMGFEKRKELDFQSGVAASLDLLGNYYLETRDFIQANTCYSQSLEIKREYNDRNRIAKSLFDLVRANISLSEDSAVIFLNELREINQDLDSPSIKSYAILSEALILKNSDRILKKAQALSLIKDMLQITLPSELSIFAYLELIDLLIYELKFSNDKELYNEIISNISKIEEIADAQHMIPLKIKSLIFNYKAALLNLHTSQASQYLLEAESLAREYGLRYLGEIVSSEYDQFLDNFEKWKEMSNSSHPISELIELSQFEKIFNQPKPSEPQSEDQPNSQVLLIANEKSILFSSQLSDKVLGSIETIDFHKLVYSYYREHKVDTNSIYRIPLRPYTILTRFTPHVSFALVIEGNSFYEIQKLDAFIEMVIGSSVWKFLNEEPGLGKEKVETTLQKLSDSIFSTESQVESYEVEKFSKKLDEDIESVEFQKELLSHKFLLHPVRLSIIKILHTYFRYPASELKHILQIPWGTFNDHIVALKKHGLIDIQKEFLTDTAQNILYLTPQGTLEYTNLKSALASLMDI